MPPDNNRIILRRETEPFARRNDSAYTAGMGTRLTGSDWARARRAERIDRAALSLPPLIGCGGLVYLFGPEFLPFRAPGAIVAMIAGTFVLTLWWLATYRPRVRGDFQFVLTRAYADVAGLAVIAALLAVFLGTFGLALIGAYSGYIAAFTYVRLNWPG